MTTIDSLLKQIEELTANTVRNVESLTEEQLEGFVQERQQLIERLKDVQQSSPGVTEAQQRFFKRIVEQDRIIAARMMELKSEATRQLINLKKVSRQKSAYDQRYTPDSLFYDRRK